MLKQNSINYYINKYLKQFSIKLDRDFKKLLREFLTENQDVDMKVLIQNLKDYDINVVGIEEFREYLNYSYNDITTYKNDYFNSLDYCYDDSKRLFYDTINNDLLNNDLRPLTLEFLRVKNIDINNFYRLYIKEKEFFDFPEFATVHSNYILEIPIFKNFKDPNKYVLTRVFSDNYKYLKNRCINIEQGNELEYQQFKEVLKVLKRSKNFRRYLFNKHNKIITLFFDKGSKIIIQKTIFGEFKIILNTYHIKEVVMYFQKIMSFKYFGYKRINKINDHNKGLLIPQS